MSLHPVSRCSIPILLLALAAPLGGCARPHTALVSGTFEAEAGDRTAGAEPLSWKPSATLTLDMDALQAKLTTAAGEQGFTVASEGTLDNGDCAAEVTAEWATLQGGTPVVEGVSFDAPVIFTLCASQPLRVILAENGAAPPSAESNTPPRLIFAGTAP